MDGRGDALNMVSIPSVIKQKPKMCFLQLNSRHIHENIFERFYRKSGQCTNDCAHCPLFVVCDNT